MQIYYRGRMGAYPPHFKSFGGIRTMRPREAYPIAPTVFEFNDDALARCLQDMPIVLYASLTVFRARC